MEKRPLIPQLVDDALNLARAGRLDYDIAFRVVLTMEHETDYSVWKAFIRNMDFIKKRLELMVSDEEDEMDPDIYLVSKFTSRVLELSCSRDTVRLRSNPHLIDFMIANKKTA